MYTANVHQQQLLVYVHVHEHLQAVAAQLRRAQQLHAATTRWPGLHKHGDRSIACCMCAHHPLRYSSFEVVRKLRAAIWSARMICFLKATFNTIRSQVRRSKALVWSGSKLRRMSLPSTAGLTWSNVLPVDLRLHANAPVFCDVIIGFCLMESPHCSHH